MSDDQPTERSSEQRFRVRPVVRPSHRPGDPEGTASSTGTDRVVSRDETDEGWGDAPTRRDAEWYDRERPPHHE